MLATPGPAEASPPFQDSEDTSEHAPATVSPVFLAVELDLGPLKLFPEKSKKVEKLITSSPDPDKFKYWKYDEKSAVFLRLFDSQSVWKDAATNCLSEGGRLRMPVTYSQFLATLELAGNSTFWTECTPALEDSNYYLSWDVPVPRQISSNDDPPKSIRIDIAPETLKNTCPEVTLSPTAFTVTRQPCSDAKAALCMKDGGSHEYAVKLHTEEKRQFDHLVRQHRELEARSEICSGFLSNLSDSPVTNCNIDAQTSIWKQPVFPEITAPNFADAILELESNLIAARETLAMCNALFLLTAAYSKNPTPGRSMNQEIYCPPRSPNSFTCTQIEKSCPDLHDTQGPGLAQGSENISLSRTDNLPFNKSGSTVSSTIQSTENKQETTSNKTRVLRKPEDSRYSRFMKELLTKLEHGLNKTKEEMTSSFSKQNYVSSGIAFIALGLALVNLATRLVHWMKKECITKRLKKRSRENSDSPRLPIQPRRSRSVNSIRSLAPSLVPSVRFAPSVAYSPAEIIEMASDNHGDYSSESPVCSECSSIGSGGTSTLRAKCRGESLSARLERVERALRLD